MYGNYTPTYNTNEQSCKSLAIMSSPIWKKTPSFEKNSKKARKEPDNNLTKTRKLD